MHKTIIMGAATVALAGLFAATTASAYNGNSEVRGPEYSPERHQVMTQAFEAGDYQSWKEQMGDRGRVTQVITEENFDRFTYAHQLMQEGKTEEARAIKAELGLGNHQRKGEGCQENRATRLRSAE